VARLEQEGEGEGRGQRLKHGLEGPLAAQGDALLWMGARPAIALAGGLLAWLTGFWGPILFLVLYNTIHLGLRVGGVFWGYRTADRVYLLLRSPWLRGGIAFFQVLVLILALILLGVLFKGSEPAPGVVGVVALGAGILVGRRGFARSTTLALGAIITGLVFAFVFSFGAP